MDLQYTVEMAVEILLSSGGKSTAMDGFSLIGNDLLHKEKTAIRYKVMVDQTAITMA